MTITATQAGTYTPAGTDLSLVRMGYGAMQLAGANVFGPPKDEAAAIEVLRTAIELGVNHVDTADFYGPHTTNQLIRKALSPYPTNLTVVTKIGCFRGEGGSWDMDRSNDGLKRAVDDNLRNLGREQLDVVNLRLESLSARPKGRLPNLSRLYSICSGRGSSAMSASAPSPPIRSRKHATSARSSVSRTTTTLRIAAMTPSSMIWQSKASPMCPISRWAASRPFSRTRSLGSLRQWKQRR